MARLRFVVVMVGLLITLGCGKPGKVSEPVSINGRVTFPNGTPVKDVVLHLQPTQHSRYAASFKLVGNGSFRGELIPGKYTFYFAALDSSNVTEINRSQALLRAVPEKYHSPDVAHFVDISSGNGDIQIRLQ